MIGGRRTPAGAWWCWALGLSLAAAQSFDALLLGLILATTWLTVIRHGDHDAMRTFRFYAILGGVIVAMRIAFRVVLGGGGTGAVLFTLPEIPLPEWASGIRLGGSVSTGELTSGFADGLRLGTIVVCVGAANGLADPRRVLRSLPRSLHSVGTAVTVALGLAPQLVLSAGQVRRAMRARAGSGSRTMLLRLINPVVADALDRTTSLAVAMEVRGFGRPLETDSNRLFAGTAVGLLLVAIGLYLLLDASLPMWIALFVFAAGLSMTAAGMRAAGRRRSVTVYRPETWSPVAWLVAGSGIAAGLGVTATIVFGMGAASGGIADPPLLAVAAVLIGALPGAVVGAQTDLRAPAGARA